MLIALALAPFFPHALHAESLRDEVVSALQDSPVIETAINKYMAAEENRNVERANYYPEISASMMGGRAYQDNATSRGLDVTRGAGYTGLGEGNVALQYKIFDGYETKNRVKAASARVESQNYNIMDVEGETTINVAKGYIDLLRIHRALNLLSGQMEVLKDYEARIIDMVSEGVSDETELQQARDVAMIMEGMVADYEGQYAAAQARYVEVTGKMPPSIYEIPHSLEPYLHESIEEAVDLAQENHPALMSAQMARDATAYDKGVERSELYPDFTGELSYMKSSKKDLVGGETEDARAVVRMNWDFSLGGREDALIKKKEYEYEEAKTSYDAMLREVERDIHTVYANYYTLQRKMILAEKRVDLNEKLLEAYKVQFEGARISLLSLMRAQSQLFNARLTESDNMYQLLASEYEILATTGELKDILVADAQDVNASSENGE